MGQVFAPIVEKELKEIIADQLIKSNGTSVMRELVTVVLTWENILNYEFLRSIFKRYYDNFSHVRSTGERFKISRQQRHGETIGHA